MIIKGLMMLPFGLLAVLSLSSYPKTVSAEITLARKVVRKVIPL